MAEDKTWAKSYILDPLTAPDPSDETGPGTHFRSTFAPQPSTSTPPASAASPTGSNNPFRRKPVSLPSKDATAFRARPTSSPSTNPFSSDYPTPPGSASPRAADYRQDAFAAYADGVPRRSNTVGSNAKNGEPRGGRPRTSSLGERFPGDDSNRPLDIIRRESKRANRSPHLRKKHLPGPDMIDRLDVSTGRKYHHEGPYDAALIARNTSWESSPIAAVTDATEEALKATPRENVLDAVTRHRPLDGVAIIPPGGQDRFGRTYNYKEGTNMMIELGGNYKRWPGINYHPDDIKGKGEPSFSIDRALKEHKMYGDAGIAGGIELQDRPAVNADPVAPVNVAARPQDESGAASGSNKRHSLNGLKKRFGSLRRKKNGLE